MSNEELIKLSDRLKVANEIEDVFVEILDSFERLKMTKRRARELLLTAVVWGPDEAKKGIP